MLSQPNHPDLPPARGSLYRFIRARSYGRLGGSEQKHVLRLILGKELRLACQKRGGWSISGQLLSVSTSLPGCSGLPCSPSSSSCCSSCQSVASLKNCRCQGAKQASEPPRRLSWHVHQRTLLSATSSARKSTRDRPLNLGEAKELLKDSRLPVNVSFGSC